MRESWPGCGLWCVQVVVITEGKEDSPSTSGGKMEREEIQDRGGRNNILVPVKWNDAPQ